MTISFFPPREKVSIRATPDSATLLHFSATFSSKAEYDDIKRNGGIVELWTNIPDSQVVEGQWRAISFEDWDADIDASVHSTGTLSFGPKVESTSDSKVLHLHLAVPNSSGGEWYQYTHRIAYPRFGNIKWLGDYGRDGVLVISADESPADSDRSKTISSGTGDSKERLVAQLSPNADWSVFSIQEDGSAQVCSLARAVPPNTVMTVFTPLVRPNTFVVPSVLSLAVPRGSQISVTDKGSIFVDSLSFCSVGDYHRMLDTASCDAIIMSSKGSPPKTMSIIPLSDLRLPTVRIHLHTLATLVPPGTTELSIFSPGSVDHRYLSIPPDHDADAAIDLMVGKGCSQLVVVPVYYMVPKHKRLWKVSVMTSHKLVTKNLEKSTYSLLTPPPSPKISTVLADVSEPLSAMPLPVQSDTDSLAKQSAEKTTVAVPMPPLVTRKSTGVISLITLFIIWLLKAWLTCCLYFVMLSLRRRSSGELHFHEEKENLNDNDVGEATIVLQDIEPSVEDERSINTVADEHVTNVEDNDEKHDASPSPLMIDIPTGEILMLLQPSIAGQSVEDVRITLDGNPVTPSTEVLPDGTSLIRFSGGESGGRVSLVGLQ